MSSWFSYEQEDSAHSILSLRSIRTGDLTRAVMGFGLVPTETGTGFHAAFCSAEVEPIEVLERAPDHLRARTIGGAIRFGNPHILQNVVLGRGGIFVAKFDIHVGPDINLLVLPGTERFVHVKSPSMISTLRKMFGRSEVRRQFALV